MDMISNYQKVKLIKAILFVKYLMPVIKIILQFFPFHRIEINEARKYKSELSMFDFKEQALKQ